MIESILPFYVDGVLSRTLGIRWDEEGEKNSPRHGTRTRVGRIWEAGMGTESGTILFASLTSNAPSHYEPRPYFLH